MSQSSKGNRGDYVVVVLQHKRKKDVTAFAILLIEVKFGVSAVIDAVCPSLGVNECVLNI